MIDIKTLRIGSHVLMDCVRAKVMRLNTVKYNEVETFHILVRGISPDTGAVGECGCFADDKAVQPIPITPALLKELGFEWRDSSSCWSKEVGEDVWLFVNGKEEQGFRFSLFPPYEKGVQEPILYARHLHEIEGQLAYYGVELIQE